MRSHIRLWSVVSGKLVQLEESSFGQAHKERDLETWVEQTPSLLGQDLRIIGRQVFIPNVGPLDLLAVSKTKRRLVVIEFKRQQTTRDTIAQILDYASSLQRMKPDERHSLSGIDHEALSDVEDFDPAMILVAAEADESTERIVEYLAAKAQLPIELVTFTYCTLEDGREIIARQILIPEAPAAESNASSAKISFEELLSIADGRGIFSYVNCFRQLEALGWWDERFRNNGGTVRYWIQSLDSSWRVIFGMNIGGKRLASPHGQLDVWLNLDIVSNCAEISVDRLVEELKSFVIINKSERRIDLRLSNDTMAKSLYKLLDQWNTMVIRVRSTLQTGDPAPTNND